MILSEAQQIQVKTIDANELEYIATSVSKGMPFERALDVLKAGGYALQVHCAMLRGMSFEDAMVAVKVKACTLDVHEAMRKGMGLSKAVGNEPEKDLLLKVAQHILDKPALLNMDELHARSGTHCLAGWGITLHPQGARLEAEYGWEIAARSLLGHRAAEYFYRENDEVLEFLSTVAEIVMVAA